MLRITEKENVLMRECICLKQEDRRLYIYGSGIAGQMIFHALQSYGITADGFCVDEQYCKPGMFCCGKAVISAEVVEQMAQAGSRLIVFVAFAVDHTRRWKVSEYLKVIDGDFTSQGASLALMEDGKIDRAFVDAHTEALNELYHMLGDEKSRQCMNAFLEQKISGSLEYLAGLHEGNQYYVKDLVRLDHVSCMIDCGAYDGDSFRAFCQNYKQETGKDYSGTAFLLEPDSVNFQKLSGEYSGQENIVLMNMGAWDCQETLSFAEGNTTSSISKGGAISIKVDTIDHIVNQKERGRVDFIKMDIEGSELRALKGAEAVIKKDHPVLAVCVYHKKEDLLTIPQYIRQLYGGYRLYLRAHSRYCLELVLYALPDEKTAGENA